MKDKIIFLTSSLAAVVLVTTAAEIEGEKGAELLKRQSSALTGDPAHSSTNWSTRELEPLGEVIKASDVLGREVRNLQDEKLGKVDELGVDLESGRVVYAVVGTGGILGVGSKNVAVPPQALHYDSENKVVHLDSSVERLKGAPIFEIANWESHSQSNAVIQVYRYYDTRPYFVVLDHGKRQEAPVPVLGYVTRASKLVGATVKNEQNEKVGSVENLMINLERGRVAQVVVSSGGFLGMGDELSVMPPSAFRYDSTEKLLRANVTKDDLVQAPHFKKNAWPNFSDPQYADTVYRAYRVEPYFKPTVEADNTGRNAQDRERGSLTAQDQSAAPSDVNLTRSIRREIVAQDTLSVNARNVKIITRDGKVTLRGPVNSTDEKNLVAGIAARHATEDRVDNQLEVKGQGN